MAHLALEPVITAYRPFDPQGATGADRPRRVQLAGLVRLEPLERRGQVVRRRSRWCNPEPTGPSTVADNVFTLQDDGDTTNNFDSSYRGISTRQLMDVSAAPDSNTTLPVASQVVTSIRPDPTAPRTYYTFPGR